MADERFCECFVIFCRMLSYHYLPPTKIAPTLTLRLVKYIQENTRAVILQTFPCPDPGVCPQSTESQEMPGDPGGTGGGQPAHHHPRGDCHHCSCNLHPIARFLASTTTACPPSWRCRPPWPHPVPPLSPHPFSQGEKEQKYSTNSYFPNIFGYINIYILYDFHRVPRYWGLGLDITMLVCLLACLLACHSVPSEEVA